MIDSTAIAVCLRVAATRRGHLFPTPPAQSGYHTRRRRLADTIERLMGVCASAEPRRHRRSAARSTPPRSSAHALVQTVLRSALGEGADYGYCAGHSRFFWGFEVALRSSPSDGTPPALTLA